MNEDWHAAERLHAVYPGGPSCNPNCPGEHSMYHDGYADGYENGESAERRATVALDLRHLAEAGIAGTVGRVTPETWQAILALLAERDAYQQRAELADDALAAERRAMLSLLAGPDDRVTGADYKRAAQTLADYRAEERRATVERVLDALYKSGAERWSDIERVVREAAR